MSLRVPDINTAIKMCELFIRLGITFSCYHTKLLICLHTFTFLFHVKIIYHNETANDELFIFAWDGSDLQPNVIRSK